jgi:hypothetical protein
MHRLPPLVALLAILLLPLTASALMIDDFSGSTQSVTDSVAGGGVASSEEAHSVLGGSRFVSASQGLGYPGGSVTTSAGGGTGSFSHTGAGFGSAGFYYDGAVDGTSISMSLNADLTQGGTLDRFQIDVLSVSGSVTLEVYAFDVDSSAGFHFAVPTPGTYEVLFSALHGIDLTDVRWLFLDTIFGLGGEDNVVLNSFSAAVPEPSTAFLLAAGLTAIAVRRRSAGA